jgi:hypothetical protein
LNYLSPREEIIFTVSENIIRSGLGASVIDISVGKIAIDPVSGIFGVSGAIEGFRGVDISVV